MSRISTSNSAAVLTSHFLEFNIFMISFWPKLTTRFAGTGLQIGRLYISQFRHMRLSFHCPKAVETKTGICDLYALNFGPWCFIYEVPIKLRESVFC
jgi:hypothetical protein